MHGFQHQYVMRDRGLFGFDARSEFAGLPWYEQERKVRSAVVIFEREGVRPEVWVAPNHSFDRTTLSVLRDSGLPVVCDGMALYPYVDRRGTVWIPQQLWKFRPRRVGVWTVCLHPNKWTRLGVAAFDMTLAEYGSRLTDVPSVLAVYGDRRQGLVDEWFRAYRRVKRTAKRAILSSPAAPRDRLRAR
jgi:predicted deacetylase